jgi:phage/plasmid-like protein (TIGR03299 family)
MSTPMRDVNAEFSALKAAQAAAPAARLDTFRGWVANGEATESEGPGGILRFRINTGMDAGEVFTFDPKTLDMEMITGLDTMANGETALWLGKGGPAWHSLGTVDLDGSTDINYVLVKSGLNYTTELREVRYSWLGDRDVNEGPELRSFPSQRVTVRSDTGAPLGVVGPGYEPWHNYEAFRHLQDIAGQGVPFESAGSLRGGATAFVSMEIPKDMVIDPSGVADVVKLFLMTRVTHDGSAKNQTVITPWRPVCGNTLRFGIDAAMMAFQIRHTRNMRARMGEATRILGLTERYATGFVAEETKLIQTDLTLDDFDKFIADLWATDDETEPSKRGATLAAKRTNYLHDVFELEIGRVGSNAYAAEQAVTNWFDYGITRQPRSDLTPLQALGQAIVEGDQDAKRSKAHRALLTLANR